MDDLRKSAASRSISSGQSKGIHILVQLDRGGILFKMVLREVAYSLVDKSKWKST